MYTCVFVHVCDCVCVCVCLCVCFCSLLPGNQILISKYLARIGVVVSGGWSNGSGWQQTTVVSDTGGNLTMHRVPPVSRTTTTMCMCLYMCAYLTITLSLQFMIQELNTFYLKAILWVPPNHMLNLYREILYALAGACACNEIYHYLSTR